MNEKLWKARFDRCLSIADVCRAISIDRRTYQRWEHGKSVPQPYYRKKLVALFDMSLEELGFDKLSLLFAHISTAVTPHTAQAVVTELDHTSVEIPSDLLDIGVLALRLAQQQHGWTHTELQEQTMSKLSQPGQPGNISRREFGTLLASLPLAALSLSTIPEEVLPYCEAALISAWKLARGKDLFLAQAITGAYLPKLQPLAQQESPVQEAAAQLATKSHILNGLIDTHLGNMTAREQHCLQAVQYATISGDKDLEAISRRWLACTYYYQRNPARALQAYQLAGRDLGSVAPLIRSSVLVESAVVQAQTGQKQLALRSLGEAHESFHLDDGENQDNYYTGQDIGVLTVWSGMTYYDLGQYRQSLDVLLEVDGLQPKQPVSERVRLQFLNHQALASLKLGELEQAVTYLKAGATGAIELGSKLRHDEAIQIYQIMEFLHADEKQVQELKPLFLERL